MLHYGALFLLIAIVSFVLGFFGYMVSGLAITLAKILFFVFLALFIVTVSVEFIRRKKRNNRA